MRISLLIKTIQPGQSNPKLCARRRWFFTKKPFEKADLIIEMTGRDPVLCLSSEEDRRRPLFTEQVAVALYPQVVWSVIQQICQLISIKWESSLLHIGIMDNGGGDWGKALGGKLAIVWFWSTLFISIMIDNWLSRSVLLFSLNPIGRLCPTVIPSRTFPTWAPHGPKIRTC